MRRDSISSVTGSVAIIAPLAFACVSVFFNCLGMFIFFTRKYLRGRLRTVVAHMLLLRAVRGTAAAGVICVLRYSASLLKMKLDIVMLLLLLFVLLLILLLLFLLLLLL